MTEWPPIDPADASAVADRREDVLAAVEEHAGRIAYQLARLQGGDYGQATVETDRAEWTLSYEAGDLEYLRYDPTRGSEVYVVSTQRPPESAALARALEDYSAFVSGFEAYVESRRGALDDVSTEFPEVASTDGVVAERDRVLDRIRDVCDRIARQLRRYEGGEYGTYTARVAGTRWELKYDEDGASYLRVGGSSGVYLLSQYQPPSAADIREYAPRFSAFVETYNDHVAELEADLAGVEL
ncbi:hypothetical protein GJ629_08825 [Halapricum sp. CBA1109]|uniref:hypothetical protein n=1 Tax=Halapricum sp. CBA1109 TaxID=2668068 RepID=UPI0012FCE046|nr:hypothetical protein [Halapricum sp. CBA1109]MUV89982.1 hypothetical protein [Halapricum sp. CBA1109]